MPNRVLWSEESVRDALQLIAEGLAELVGFGVTSISVRRHDELVVVASAGGTVAGSTGADARHPLGRSWPVAELEEHLRRGQPRGMFTLVHHGPSGQWDPRDIAVAPCLDADGTLRAVISVEEPHSGKAPDEAQLRVMDKYAAEITGVVLGALEREHLARRLRLAEATRDVIRRASRHLSPDDLVLEIGDALREAFFGSGLWVRIYPSPSVGAWVGSRTLSAIPGDVQDALQAAADRLWKHQQVAVASVDGPQRHVSIDLRGFTDSIAYLRAHEMGSAVHAPLGAGSECVGSLIITRTPEAPPWSEDELDALGEIGRDLGRSIVNAQTFDRERRLVEQLRELDAEKSRLVATLSHELKNPLAALRVNLELLGIDLAGHTLGRRLVADVEHNAGRMSHVVDSLLTLAKVADPDNPPDLAAIDLNALVTGLEEPTRAALGLRRQTLLLEPADVPAVVHGDRQELRSLVFAIASNAIKFSPEGSTSRVEVRVLDEEIELVVADRGIGIAPADLERLFTDFFRSTDPAVLSRRGSGLGLTIVDRVVRRHGGRVSVESAVGVGTTVRVRLPRFRPA